MAATRPKLPALKTPTTATFPLSFPASFPGDALLSASSVRTPLSALSFKGPLASAGLYSSGLPSAGLPSAPLEYPPTPSMLSAKPTFDDKPEKTPITPPLAYMDFLKTINPASPAIASPPLTAPLPLKAALKRTATSASTDSVETAKSEESRDSTTEEDDLDSAPTTASSISTDSECSCTKENTKPPTTTTTTTKHTKPAPISIKHIASPSGVYPLSAPATGPTTFPSLRVPPSPAVDSPAVRSPWSARSVKSPFDWDAALKAKRYTELPVPGPTSAGPAPGQHARGCEKKGTSIRNIREVVTRTVTYTPRMEPAPRGKRRKLNDEVEAAE